MIITKSPNKISITVLILTKNEELAIAECIKSVSDFDQVLVIDSNSSDKTQEIVESLGITLIDFIWDGKYPKKKQWALERKEIRNDWVLFLDADENVTPELSNEICRIIECDSLDSYAAFEIPILYTFMGKILRYGHKVRKIALVNRKLCDFPVVNDLHVLNMWEVEGHYQPNFRGRLGRMNSFLKHLDPDPLFDYFERHNRYSDWEAEIACNSETSNAVLQSRTSQGRFFNKFPFRPLLFFCYSYLFRRGFLDGRAGFNYAIALSFYYWQISIKVLERNNRA